MLEFQNTLFSTRLDLADAIAREWVSAGGNNSPAEIAEMIKTPNWAANEVRECIEAWDLSSDWLAERDLDAHDLCKAFAEYVETAVALEASTKWIREAAANDEDALIDAIAALYNCHDVEVDETGRVWISNPQRGHWLDADGLAKIAREITAGNI